MERRGVHADQRPPILLTIVRRSVWRPRQDSNLRTRLRRAVLYPLSYEGRRPIVSLSGAAAAGRYHGVAMPRVLVIDDDPVIVELLRVNFEIEGFEVVSAGDGREGVERAKRERPDLVLTDIMMPRFDGLQLLRQLKDDPATRSLPVILLSAKAQSAEVQQGLELGADDYVTKPFDPLELIDRVNAVLAKAGR